MNLLAPSGGDLSHRGVLPILFLVLFSSACIGENGEKKGEERIVINGAGASFPYPLIAKWAEEYKKVSRGRVIVNYQSIGSGGGIRQMIERSIDFGASDVPMSPEEYTKAKGTVLHIPEAIGAVVIIYNLPGIKGRLKLDGEAISKIYLGEIDRWDDPLLKKLNPEIDLPSERIVVVKRADSSGTTFIFTDYLSSVSERWSKEIGRGKNFPFTKEIGDRGVQAKGNEGVTAAVKQNPYSIGYVELTYAIQNKLVHALLMNREENFVEANLETISSAALNSIEELPEWNESWYGFSIVNAPGERSYPMSSFTYILLYQDLSYMPEEKAKALVDFLEWVLTEGQKYCEPLGYVPLPEEVVKRNLEAISKVRVSEDEGR